MLSSILKTTNSSVEIKVFCSISLNKQTNKNTTTTTKCSKRKEKTKREDILSVRSVSEEGCYLKIYEPCHWVCSSYFLQAPSHCYIHRGCSEHGFETKGHTSTALFNLLFRENILSTLYIIVQVSLMCSSSVLIFCSCVGQVFRSLWSMPSS